MNDIKKLLNKTAKQLKPELQQLCQAANIICESVENGVRYSANGKQRITGYLIEIEVIEEILKEK